jgi:hypothetical protein
VNAGAGTVEKREPGRSALFTVWTRIGVPAHTRRVPSHQERKACPREAGPGFEQGSRRNTFLAVHSGGIPSSSESIAARFVEDAGFLASNLLPEHTGVDGAVVWIFAGEFSRADAQHGPRVLVVPGRELRVATLIDAVAVTLATPPDVLGSLPGESDQVVEWVERNRDVLLEYWQGEMATDDALELLARLNLD